MLWVAAGPPSTKLSGELGAHISPQDSPEALEGPRVSGPRPEADTETCSYVASTASKSNVCFRYGGVESIRMVWAGLGRGEGGCEVRVKLSISTSWAGTSLQEIDGLRGMHSHVIRVFKLSSTLVPRVCDWEHPPADEDASGSIWALLVSVGTAREKESAAPPDVDMIRWGDCVRCADAQDLVPSLSRVRP